ncbi:MAG: TlpA family protein disulfide reductase [Chlorobiaceae bacterium]|nr:TlpA family protein disulfide reductase [Chlorobiaceae bacterium]
MKSIRLSIAAALLGICTTGASGVLSAEAVTTTSVALAAGKIAPSFSIKKLNGAMLGSAQLSGKPYIVNFFASWCPPCRQELPDMVELQKKYADQGFTFIGIAFRDRESTLPDFLWEMGVDYPVTMTTPELEAAYGRFLPGGKISVIPVSIVVGRDGRILDVVTGGLTKADFESLILKSLLTKPAR